MPFVGTPGLPELIIVGIIALLLFGKRLPDVARSLGKGIVEFKKGIQGIEEEVERATYNTDTSASRPLPTDETEETNSPKFQPPDTPPKDSSDTTV